MNNTQLERQTAKLEEYSRQTKNIQLLTMGINGHEFVSDDSYSGKTFCALIAWDGADADVDYDVIQLDGTVISHAGVTLADGGMPIYGVIKNLVVNSGAVCAYYGLNIG